MTAPAKSLRLVEAPARCEPALDENDVRMLLIALDGLSVDGIDGKRRVLGLYDRLAASLPVGPER